MDLKKELIRHIDDIEYHLKRADKNEIVGLLEAKSISLQALVKLESNNNN